MYDAIAKPVSMAAMSAGRSLRPGRPPMKTSAIRPAETARTPSSSVIGNSRPSTTTETSATTHGDVPLASGYIWLNSPSS